ncbi:MAG: hypothetical protein KDK05_26770 [Candidatus Competibacteraceae bacterium]|nr:hypothetical protein [Candidatus Competibacteraceae bacterium]
MSNIIYLPQRQMATPKQEPWPKRVHRQRKRADRLDRLIEGAIYVAGVMLAALSWWALTVAAFVFGG